MNTARLKAWIGYTLAVEEVERRLGLSWGSEACEFCGLRNVVDHSEECLSQKASDWPHFSESARYGLSSVQWFERLESREYYRDNQ